jgi:hypothetical protein
MQFRILLAICLILFFSSAYGQSEHQLCNLFNLSVEKCMEKQKIYFQLHPPEAVFLKDNMLLACSFSEKNISHFKISLFDEKRYSKKQLKKGLVAYRIHPFELTNDTITFSFTRVEITRKRNNYTISSSDSFTYRYRFHCESGKWEFFDEIVTGI